MDFLSSIFFAILLRMIALELLEFISTIVSSCDNTPETYPSDPKPH
jgi:hypothetical protein